LRGQHRLLAINIKIAFCSRRQRHLAALVREARHQLAQPRSFALEQLVGHRRLFTTAGARPGRLLTGRCQEGCRTIASLTPTTHEGDETMKHPVVWFEVLARDGERMQKFFTDLFGWKIDADNPLRYGSVDTAGATRGIPGGVGGAFEGTRPWV